MEDKNKPGSFDSKYIMQRPICLNSGTTLELSAETEHIFFE
jgi:hypothetical protein